MSMVVEDAFSEEDHPRANNGQFSSGGGSGSSSSHDVDREVAASRIEPVNSVDPDKVESLAESMRRNGWSGRPVLAYEGANGTTAATGSHRIAAAHEAGIDVPVMNIGDDVLYYTDEDGNTLADLIGTGDDRPLEKFLREAGDDRAADLIQAEIDANYSDDISMDRKPIDSLAMDLASVRTRDENGYLHVEASNISKANVCPYRGGEIPNCEALGLDQQKVYQLLRDPGELEKAAATFNGVPILNRHIPVMSEKPPKEAIVGTTGTDAEFKTPFLRNSLTIWDASSIAGIETNQQRELSCGYRYDADMTPGEFDGVRYDGVMRNLRANHIALVPDGRAGPDVIVGDSKLPTFPIVKDMNHMTKVILSRKGALAKGALSVYLVPKLAQDAKLDFGAILKGVTAKNFKAEKANIVSRLKTAAEGKLAQDATLDDVNLLLDKLDDTAGVEDDPANVTVDDDPDMTGDADEEALKAFLKDKLKPEDHAKFCEMLGGKPAVVGDDEPKGGVVPGGEKKPETVTKQAMDAAIEAGIKAANDATVARLNAVRDAERDVRPYIGELAMAQDSAEAVYRSALDMVGVAHKDIKEVAALKAVLHAQPKPGTRQPAPMATDAASAGKYATRFPNASRLAN
jgi:uncharacterized protein